MARPNHRELILSRSGRKCKSTFLELPEALQDQVIDGLDRGELTLVEASDLVSERGHGPLSYEAISNYYRLIRRERRLFDIRNALASLVAEFQGTDTEANARALLNLALAQAIQGLADGDIQIKDLDLSRMMTVLGSMEKGTDGAEHSSGPGVTPGGLTDEAADLIRKKILGLRG